jgi:hypothetical protein
MHQPNLSLYLYLLPKINPYVVSSRDSKQYFQTAAPPSFPALTAKDTGAARDRMLAGEVSTDFQTVLVRFFPSVIQIAFAFVIGTLFSLQFDSDIPRYMPRLARSLALRLIHEEHLKRLKA